MRASNLREAKAEAKRFLKKVDELEDYFRHNASASKDFLLMCGSKETGAVRRASMDLTRALADIRR